MKSFIINSSYYLNNYGVGVNPAATQAAIQVPCPAAQAKTAIGVPTPNVTETEHLKH